MYQRALHADDTMMKMQHVPHLHGAISLGGRALDIYQKTTQM